jgi:hypothetical protein
VENASLVPWMTGVAGLHTHLIFKATGHSLRATFLFFILTYLFILYSTFRTRSGILGETSVHAFTDLGMNWQLLSYLLVFTIPALFWFFKSYNQIPTIKKEEEVDKIFKVYIELVGKKGVSKLVLRSVLPIINSELQRLLEDVVEFEIEIFINDKNDVQFLLIKDGVSKLLKSGSGLEKTAASLALRAVLGKLSTLPMPNFITFDEVLGKVAPDNLEKLKLLFDKIKDMYDIVFFITHNDVVKDWATNVVTVVKNNNLSKITFN